MTSRLDYSNSLSAGLPKAASYKTQLKQKSAMGFNHARKANIPLPRHQVWGLLGDLYSFFISRYVLQLPGVEHICNCSYF